MKPDIERYARKIIGSDSSDVVSLAVTCLDKDYDMKKTFSKLSSLVSESRATKFTEKLFSLVDKLHNSTSKKRRREENEEEDRPTEKKSKLIKSEEPSGALEPGIDKIKEMMAKAQKEIQQRKIQMNLTTPQSAPSVAAGQQLNDDISERLKRASELKAQIQARIQSSNISNVIGQAVSVPLNVPPPIVLDNSGRAIDPKTGQPVQLQMYTPTLKANIKTTKKDQVKEKPKEAPQLSKFFDNRIALKSATRNKKKMIFFEPGKFVKIGDMMRAKAQLEILQNEVATAAKKTGIASAAKLAVVQPKQENTGDVPDVEWWDSVILKADTYSNFSEPSPANFEDVTNFDVITNLIEHPIQLKPHVDKDQKVELPLMLTKKETKKMRKQNRAEAQKEIQEKIRLGLMQPPGPKVKMSNLMRVLGTEAVQDPTKVEMHVRAQMAKRVKDHEEANAARKLTKEQLREKNIKKIKEDTSSGVIVSVYRIRDFSDKKKQFKVQTNAMQLFMTGIVVVYSGCTVVVVEGGRKQQDKFKKLMLRRIKWENGKISDDSDDEGDIESAKANDCKLIWEGSVKNRAFGEMKFNFSPSEAYAREQFKRHSVEHYWDLAFSSTVLETTE